MPSARCHDAAPHMAAAATSRPVQACAPSKAGTGHGARQAQGLVAVALLLTVLLRLPSVAWSAISDDEGIYDAAAVVLAQGGTLYVDALDHKPPGLAYAYAALTALLPSGAGPRARAAAAHALGAAAALGTALGLALLAGQLAPTVGRGWPALLYAVSSTAKVPFDGLAVNGELLMGLPSVWALVAAERAGRSQGRRFALLDLLAGSLLGLATLFKWQAALLGIAFLLLGPPTGRTWRTYGWRLLAWGAGAGLPLCATAGYFARQGNLGHAYLWGLSFNRLYLAAGGTGAFWWHRLLVSLGGAALPSIVLYAAGLLQLARVLRRPAASPLALAIAAWALLSLWAVGLGGRFFGHYYLQAELPLCLLAAGPVSRAWQRRPRLLSCLLAAPAAVFFLLALSPERALATLNADDPNWPAVGAELAALARPGDTLFVWGNAPLLYHFADLPMGTRFAFCNYLTGLSPATPTERGGVKATGHGNATELAWQLLAHDVVTRRPTLLVDTAAADWKGYGSYPMADYPQLRGWTEQNYVRVGALAGRAPVYRRR